MRTFGTWLIFVVATLWAIAIVAAPHVHVHASRDASEASAGAGTAGEPRSLSVAGMTALVYLTGSVICHQRPERSFHAGRVQYPVCARCTGLYLAAPFGLLALLLMRRAKADGAGAGAGDADAYRRWRVILLCATVPTLVSVALERLGGPSDTISRAVAALPLGAAVAACVAAALLGHFAQSRPRNAGPRARV